METIEIAVLKKTKIACLNFLKQAYEKEKEEFIRIFEVPFSDFTKTYEIIPYTMDILKEKNGDIKIIKRITFKDKRVKDKNNGVINFYYICIFDKNLNLITEKFD